jgi:tetratricopeptide (TPR) repeat protein
VKSLRIIVIAAIALAALACSEWAVDSTNQAWTHFDSGDVDSARYYFNDAVLWDATYAEAYNGLGWCDLLTDNLSGALGNFDEALTNDASLVDADAGAALAATETGYNDQDAIDYANKVISGNSSYVFSHLSSVTIEDIRLAKAKSAATLGKFQTALDEVKVLDSSFDADTSTSSGQAAILAKIESLISQYGG